MFRSLTLLVTLSLAAVASAHPAVVGVALHDTAATEGGQSCVYANDGPAQLRQETNGKTDQDAYAHSPVAGDTGLQTHDVCYGTFTEDDVAAYNDAEHGFRATNDVPWTADAASCAAAGGSFVPADTRIA